MSLMNQQITLVKRPVGMPQLSDFELVETTVPDLQEGEVLLKTLCFSLDPYMRGRMNEGASYAENFKLGEALSGAAICVVESSRNPSLKVGEIINTYTGWQTYPVFKGVIVEHGLPWGNAVKRISHDVRPSYFLGALGMPGFTAHHGLIQIGEPKPGETVVVSAATGAVGTMVGQLAKAMGCYVVGIAGGPEKCSFAVKELGFDACVDHKSPTLKEDLKSSCPKGIDIYFENVGGPVFWAVHPLLNLHSRVPLCGAIAWYNMTSLPEGPDLSPRIISSAIGKRTKYQGFIISDHNAQYDAFVEETMPLIESGKIKVKEDLVQGIENAPQAFIGLLQGKNFGKLVIEV
jgi:NADPH-dependent curcumin reductase